MESIAEVNQNPHMELSQGIFLLVKPEEWDKLEEGFIVIDEYLNKNSILNYDILSAVFNEKNLESFKPHIDTLDQISSMVLAKELGITRSASTKVQSYFNQIDEARVPLLRMRDQNTLVKIYFLHEALTRGMLTFRFTEVLRLSITNRHNTFKTLLKPEGYINRRQANYFMDLIYEPENTFGTLSETVIQTLFLKIDSNSLQNSCARFGLEVNLTASSTEVLSTWSQVMRRSLGI